MLTFTNHVPFQFDKNALCKNMFWGYNNRCTDLPQLHMCDVIISDY